MPSADWNVLEDMQTMLFEWESINGIRKPLAELRMRRCGSGWGDVASEGHFSGGRAWVTTWRLEWVMRFGGLCWRAPRTWGKHVGYVELGQRGWCWQQEKSTADMVKGSYLPHMEGHNWRLNLKGKRDVKWKKVSGENLVLIVGAQVIPILWRSFLHHILGHTEPRSLEALSWAAYFGESRAAAQKRQRSSVTVHGSGGEGWAFKRVKGGFKAMPVKFCVLNYSACGHPQQSLDHETRRASPSLHTYPHGAPLPFSSLTLDLLSSYVHPWLSDQTRLYSALCNNRPRGQIAGQHPGLCSAFWKWKEGGVSVPGVPSFRAILLRTP